MPVIRLRGVRKTYGPITAVDGLDLDVPEGTCVGLLGPNGAGKSTTMKMLTAQAIADEGEIEVLGHTLPGESKAARAEMGVVPQLDNLDVDAHRRAEPARVRAPVPGRRGASGATRSSARSSIANLRRAARHEGRQAVGRHAPAAADRPRARAPAAPACCWTSRPSASTRRSARSCGR